ncbi:ABC transporter permease, partial [Streptomyces eurythermus]
MPFVPVLHAEWIKIRTLRSQWGALAAILLATTAFSALAAVDADGSDPLFSVFFGVSLGQIAAIAFGTTAVSSEFRGGALRLT